MEHALFGLGLFTHDLGLFLCNEVRFVGLNRPA